MTPKEPSGNSGTLPPRVWISDFLLIDDHNSRESGRFYFKCQYFPSTEYISAPEVKELLAQAKASARAEAFEECAADLPDGLWWRAGEFRKKAKAARGKYA